MVSVQIGRRGDGGGVEDMCLFGVISTRRTQQRERHLQSAAVSHRDTPACRTAACDAHSALNVV